MVFVTISAQFSHPDDAPDGNVPEGHLSPAQCRALAQHASPEVRAMVAGNRGCIREVQELLVQDPTVKVRFALAVNQATFPEVLALLAYDEDYGVRFAVGRNPSSPEDARIAAALLNAAEDE